MPAKVIIQSGISAGTEHWIERPVIRIGSHPQADLCLPSADVPQQALTIEFRDGHYHVYNRSPSAVLLGSEQLPAGSGSIWPHTEVLQLTDDVALALEVDDQDPIPRPVSSPVADDLEEYDSDWDDAPPTDEFAQAPAKADQSSTIIQIGVIVLCVFGAIGLLARQSLRSESQQRKIPSFAAVVRGAIDSPTSSPDLVARLQYAESAAVRGNKKTAKERFGRLRDDLINQQRQFVSEDRQAELAILDFVDYRLGQLD